MELDDEPEVTKYSWKKYLILFILFIFVVSDTFIDNILSNFNSAINGRSLTVWGAMIQATLFVIIYAVLLKFVENDII